MSWDPARLQFIQADATSYPWFVSGFLPDPDGINADITDGQAIFTALASAAAPASVPPDILVVTFKFMVLSWGTVELEPSAGTFATTKVLSTVAGQEITGDISAKARVRARVAPGTVTGPLITIGPIPNVAPFVSGGSLAVELMRPVHLSSVLLPGQDPLQRLPHAVPIRLFAQEDDRGRVAVYEYGHGTSQILLFDPTSGAPLARRTLEESLAHRPRPVGLAFGPSGRFLALTHTAGTTVFDSESLTKRFELAGAALASFDPAHPWPSYATHGTPALAHFGAGLEGGER